MYVSGCPNTVDGGVVLVAIAPSASSLASVREQVAAGYILYGSSTVFVYSVGDGVHGFTLDPSVGSADSGTA